MLNFSVPSQAAIKLSHVATETCSDPVLALIETFTETKNRWYDILDKRDGAVSAAKEAFGNEPFPLIRWRTYSAIGKSELEEARDEFLELGIDPAVINKEYRDAKARCRAARQAKDDWDREAGVAPILAEVDKVRRRLDILQKKLSVAKPQTPAGAAALLIVGIEEALDDACQWQRDAIQGVIAGLQQMASLNGRDI